MTLIEISEDRYKTLLSIESHFRELEVRGVDNWEGYVGSTAYCNECDTELAWHEKDNCCV